MNELYYVVIEKKLLFLAVAIVVVFSSAFCSFKEVVSENVVIEKNLIKILNGKSFSESEKWIEQRLEELDELERELLEKSIQLSNKEISETDYMYFSAYVSNQLRAREILIQFKKQATEMNEYLIENPNSEIKYEYTSLSEKLFEENSSGERSWMSLFLAIFIVFGIMTLYPGELTNDGMYTLICISAEGRKKELYKSIVMLLMLFIMAIVMGAIWFLSLNARYEMIGWSDTAVSWSGLRAICAGGTVGKNLIVELVFYAFIWVILGSIAVITSLYCRKTVQAEILGVGAFVLIPVIKIIGDWLDNLFLARIYTYGDVIFTTQNKIMSIPLLMVAFFIMERRLKKWSRA